MLYSKDTVTTEIRTQAEHDALEDLLAQVENAEGPDRVLSAEIARTLAGWTFEKRGRERKHWWRAPGQSCVSSYNNAPPHYTWSIEAAIALATEKWKPGYWSVDAFNQATVGDGDRFQWRGNGANPALALIAALLKALIDPERTKVVSQASGHDRVEP